MMDQKPLKHLMFFAGCTFLFICCCLFNIQKAWGAKVIDLIVATVNEDIISNYLKDEYQEVKPCGRFKDGQEFIITKEDRYRPPEGFCAWAWGDIRHDILTLIYGGTIPHMKNEHANIVGCTDWYRPVIFKIERMD